VFVVMIGAFMGVLSRSRIKVDVRVGFHAEVVVEVVARGTAW
jgi:hypothetical protein